MFHYSTELVRHVKEKGLGDITVLQNLSGVEGERDMIEAARTRCLYKWAGVDTG